MPSMVVTSKVAPACARRFSRSPAVSVGRIGSVTTPYTGPVSRPASIRNVDAPVMSSPARIACWTGAAPRHAGSSEKCRFTQPCRGMSRVCWRRSAPYATTGTAVDVQIAQCREEVRIARRLRREHGQTGFGGEFRDRRRGLAASASRALCGPGHDGQDVMIGGEQGAQGRNGRRGRPGEDQSHACGLTFTVEFIHGASRIAFIAALRVSASSRSTNSTPSRWSVSC